MWSRTELEQTVSAEDEYDRSSSVVMTSFALSVRSSLLTNRPASGSKIESHNLYGQVMGELGTIGVVAFAFMVTALLWNLRKLKRLTPPLTGPVDEPRLYAKVQEIGERLLARTGVSYPRSRWPIV